MKMFKTKVNSEKTASYLQTKVFRKGRCAMALAVWRALLYKSFSIYKSRYVMTTLDILWPCLLILFLAIVKNQIAGGDHSEPSPMPYTKYEGENRMELQSMELRLDQRNNFTKYEAKKMNVNNKQGGQVNRFPDQKILEKEKFNNEKNKFKDEKIKFQDEKTKFKDAKVEFNNSIDEPLDFHDSKSSIMREICTIEYGFFLLICFIGIWSGAGTLAHAERMSGTVERMRIYAVSDWSIVLSYVMHAGLKQVISALLFSLLLTIRLGGPPLIEELDFFSLFIAIILLSLHATIYFLGIASFFNSTILRGIVGTASFIYVFLWASKQHFSATSQAFGLIFAPISIVVASNTACGLDSTGGVTLKSLISATDGNDIPLLVMPLMMLIGSVVVLFIFYYMLNINPGPYGSAQPVYFIFPQRIQEYFRPVSSKRGSSKSAETFRNGLYEKTPPNIEVGIKIQNLYKRYGNLTSVKNLSLDIYSGQITALLGHNGAGKTTTLSILSGMLSPTSGSAYYKGYDIFKDLQKFRQDIGLCPQNNLLHPNLKVINQLIFFGMVGGLSKKAAEQSANDLLKVVGILEKKYVAINKLSGGMQRKLCIALALVGKPKVVILDEPTSGVDPESRREIWNILLESRENRIMLLTTHFMEEADALGDQIAIMNHGEIVCYGSPMFLKKHYGAGYNITVSCSQDKHTKIIETVTASVPEASVIGENQDWIKFKLPFDKTEHFPALFKSLESNNETSGIGISCTTMEDVYLKVEADEGGEIPLVSKPSFLEASANEKGYLMAYIHRFMALMKKNMICTLSRWFKTFLVIIILPPVATYIAMDEIHTDFNKYKPSNKSDEGKSLSNSENQGFTDSSSALDDILGSCSYDPTLFVRVYMFSMWFIYVIFIVSSTFSNFVHKERVSTVKHLILMTGVSPITYWSSIVLWDSILYFIFVFICWLTAFIMDSSGMFERDGGFYILFLILLLAGIGMITSVYFVTLLFKTMRTVVVFYFTAVFTFGLVSYFITMIEKTQPYSDVMKLQPVTASIVALMDFSSMAAKKQNCKDCVSKECADILNAAYLKDKKLRNDFLFLAGDILLYIALVILTDYGLFPFLWDKISSLFIGKIDNTALNKVDTDVAQEMRRVGDLRSTGTQEETIALVDGLAKKYSRSMTAVYDVTFAVSKGECFGLLGVNGAGKSTTFNMLTGILYPTKGNVFIKGHSLRKEKTKCLSMIGYCPQHTALIERLTSRQMLTLFARLRLIPSNYVDEEVKKWITLFGLDEYADVPSRNYSGGNKRKLNAALAFIGEPSVILLDEPTTGVDPFIRRNLWSIIESCGSYDQSIIISSHSMDECEAVCKRLTIMARGKMECIGNTQHLKLLHGTGFVVKITLSSHTENEKKTLKEIIESTFSPHCELKDEHQVLLHYHISTNIYRISNLFDIMERIKKQSNIVDDYIITDSSLEEVFLSFAKKKND